MKKSILLRPPIAPHLPAGKRQEISRVNQEMANGEALELSFVQKRMENLHKFAVSAPNKHSCFALPHEGRF